MSVVEVFDPIALLTKDLRAAAKSMSIPEVRYLVDTYYALQNLRVHTGNQTLAMEKSGEPHAVLAWIQTNMSTLERNIQRALQVVADAHEESQWAQSIVGIGPVIAAGLLAHIDVNRAKTAGAVWRFAGLDPTVKWERGERRPWNARLKVLAWKAGESFKKHSGRENCYYGHLYRARKALEIERNEAGQFAPQAVVTLEEQPRHKQRAIYEQGKLPDGRLDLRAMRYAVKLFLAHYHHVAYEVTFNEPPPKPYILEHGGHVHYIGPPNWPSRTV